MFRRYFFLMIFKTKKIFFIFTLIVIVLLSGCKKMSEIIHDETAGMNGSFEYTKSGLPVNWLIYTPKTIPTGDYDLIIDDTEYKDGKQSLKFLVRECSPVGGWFSPGLSQENEAIPDKLYKISFWIKNDGCEFLIKIGGVSAFEGQHEIIIKSKEAIETWKLIKYNYKMPSEKKFESIRFEMNILYPGSFWIDDIKIEEISK
jgi:hypothetical protein